MNLLTKTTIAAHTWSFLSPSSSHHFWIRNKTQHNSILIHPRSFLQNSTLFYYSYMPSALSPSPIQIISISIADLLFSFINPNYPFHSTFIHSLLHKDSTFIFFLWFFVRFHSWVTANPSWIWSFFWVFFNFVLEKCWTWTGFPIEWRIRVIYCCWDLILRLVSIFLGSFWQNSCFMFLFQSYFVWSFFSPLYYWVVFRRLERSEVVVSWFWKKS